MNAAKKKLANGRPLNLLKGATIAPITKKEKQENQEKPIQTEKYQENRTNQKRKVNKEKTMRNPREPKENPQKTKETHNKLVCKQLS